VTQTIPARFLDRAMSDGERVSMRVSSPEGAHALITWREWRTMSLKFAAALLESGASDTDAVAILAGNGLAWPIADLGTLLCGKTSVGIYPTSAPVQIVKILQDCRAGVLVIDDARQLEVVLGLREQLSDLRIIISVCNVHLPNLISWDEWLGIGSAALEARPELEASIEERARAIGRHDRAIIIYTSGSTGEPKGAVLSHGCIDASAESIAATLGLTASDTTMSFLPYSHAAERITGLYTRINRGMEAALVEDAFRIWDVAAEYRPTVFGGLPRYYEKLHQIAQAQCRSPVEILGGRVRLATSGGAPLPMDIAKSLAALGLPVLGAYGLTEHLCVAFNRSDDPTFDTSGHAMPGTEIRIAGDGEVLVRRSELTFSGYNNLPEATRAAFTDDGEWLRTGDLGALDGRGRLRITGRKKELLALSNGKMVAPLPIEARLAMHPLITHAVLHAEGKRFVSALIVLDAESLASWAQARGISESAEELASHPLVAAEIQKAVDEVNGSLSRAESIRRFFAVTRELSVAESELTPTLKVRRKAVLEKYAVQLDALYNA